MAIKTGKSEDAKRAAWAMADAPTGSLPQCEGFLIARIDMGDASPDVLESFLYAAGRYFSGTGEHVYKIINRIKGDTPDFPRQAAWLALARIDPDKYRALADEYAQSDNPWDQWGMLRGRLELGDYSDIALIWKWGVGEDGAGEDWDRRQHAARLVQAYLAPLLETLGRWSIELEDKTPDTWQPADFELVRTNMSNMDLVALAADCLPHFEQARHVHSTMGKVTGGRDRIKRWLFGG